MENGPDPKREKRMVRDARGQFGPGNNANPLGRPRKGETAIDRLRRKLEDNADLLGDVAIEHALAGNFAFWNGVFDRVYGKPALTIERSQDERELAWAEMGERLGRLMAARGVDASRIREDEAEPPLLAEPVIDTPPKPADAQADP